MENNQYIEVIGEGEYQERIEEYILDINLGVKAVKEETALNEVKELKDKCIKHLIENSIHPKEIYDGGTDLRRPWNKTKTVAKEASYKITIKCDSQERLSTSLSYIESITGNQREFLNMSMRQPIFKSDSSDVTNAMKAAIADAKRKAEILSNEANVKLGNIIKIEEGNSAKRNSGAFGDEDWWGDHERFAVGAAGSAPALADEREINTPKRTIWIRYRVRFEIN